MERDREIERLMNVIRVTAKMAMRLARAGQDRESAAFCTARYNRILARLDEINPQFAPFFQPLPADSSLQVAGLACRMLAAYCEYSRRVSRARWERRARRARRHMYRMGYAGF